MPNRLADSTSPYLLQHKDNPVDWQEWGPEAFAEARRRDVLVLLSVGYAACHWCHVPWPQLVARPIRPSSGAVSSDCRRHPRGQAREAFPEVWFVCQGR
jgi:hypothetical protein